MQPTLYQQNRQQLFLMAATIFGSIVAAVIVSTVIIMSLMRGEIASALSSSVQTNNQGAQTTVVPASTAPAPSCAATPADTEASQAPVFQAASAPQPAVTMPVAVKHSFNTVNNTTNNVTNTEIRNKTVKNTTIKDSFNDNSTHTVIKDSFNPVIVKDNNVEINSNNKSIDVTKVDVNKTYNWNSNNTTVTNVASNNTSNTNVNSFNNTENHVLSDNNLVVAPLVAAPIVQVQ